MKPLRKNPHIYEINLMTWLNRLSAGDKKGLMLKDVPDRVWSDLREKGFDLIWLMGIWQRSADAIHRARRHPYLVNTCRSILDDFNLDDITGSPYAIVSYTPDPVFETIEDLIALKERLEDMGLYLILDFVPNHTACDHAWISKHPEYYIQASPLKSGKCPRGFFRLLDNNSLCIAHGKDPNFHPWTDTAQIDYTNPKAIEAMLETLVHVSQYCHGLRCDMAMLVLSNVFRKTWRRRVTCDASREFWGLAIERLGSLNRRCLLLAEVYWDMEKDMIDMGLDYAYDKTFYDLLVKGDVRDLKAHLAAPVEYQQRLIRFLENHDEPRALAVFGHEKIYSAMVIHATVPAMRFWHEGQFDGSRIKMPVQLRRRPDEPIDRELTAFSERLLLEVNQPVFHQGAWRMLKTHGWSDNQSHKDLLAWTWSDGEERRLIVVNYRPHSSQGVITIPAKWLWGSEEARLVDPLKGELYLRSAKRMEDEGLYVDLKPWDFHFFGIG
ncbi:putative alpha-amylase family protein [uncultured Desulfobacterium sp.]|uniref:Putative alpha-amylase family protein n=1 Tax=uncultured Desulfobacterium sp. TaxID=201089 RepID=A0A445MZB8_9BACT|nr:putative alpha-amylase family protein [uncultured Desulfobacterium sp.]